MWTFPDRSKLLLSGEEIIYLKQNSLKDIPSGSKDYAPNDSWLEQKQIQATLETHYSLLGAPRIEKKSNFSSAVWCPNVGKAKVTKKAGKHWEVFGHTVNSEDWLLPEEALFLLETNSLVLHLEEVPLSVEQSYALIIGDFISLAEYRVYSHLSRKGYRVLRHDKEISVTPYEKDIHADQLSLAPKRSVPGSEAEKSKNAVSSRERRKEVLSGEGPPKNRPPNDVGFSEVAASSGLNQKPRQPAELCQHEPIPPKAICGDSPKEIPIVIPGSEPGPSPHSEREPSREGPNGKPHHVPCESEQSGSKNPIAVPSSEARNLINKGNSLISQVQELISSESTGLTPSDSVGDDETASNVVVELPDDDEAKNGAVSVGVDDSSSEDEFPRPISSPDLMIVEANEQVIEIEDDEASEEGDDPDVVITDVRKQNESVDTVDLLDSDEDEDVVIVYQKPTNSDPSKWRKWFLTATEFVNFKFKESAEETTKIPKTKLIDLFDLGQKSFDSIWKAIPRHDGNDEFINAPDQRFIPSTILPKFAQYRISLHQRDISPYSESRPPTNVDTSHNLDEIIQYGQEPAYFRNEGYSFHRSRNYEYNRNAPWFNSNATRPPRNQMFGENQHNFRNNYQGIGLRSIGQPSEDQNQQQVQPVSNNTQYFNRNRFDHQNRNFGQFSNQGQHPMNFQPQGNFPQFGNFNHFGGNQSDGLRMAVMQAYQLQMFAMGLMQSCQNIMQQVPGFVSPMFPMNNLVGGNLVNMNQPPQRFHHRRPYRRPWRGQGRRRYYNDDRSQAPRVTEIPTPPSTTPNNDVKECGVVYVLSDEEDAKVKPAIKRNMALNAIASLNKPKRAKLKITTEVKSIKLDTSDSAMDVIDVDDVSSVKSKSPCASPMSSGSPKRAKKVTAASPLTKASTSAAAETLPTNQESLPTSGENANSQPVLDVSDDSRPSVFVYDEQVSVDSDSVGFVDRPLEPDGRIPPGRPEPMEEASSDAAVVPEAVAASDSRPTTSETWKTYKEQQNLLEALPSHSRALVSIGNERSDSSDVMKSLRVIGPIDESEAPRDELKVSYDVYLPNQPFKKSVRLLPNYRVVVAKSDCFPTIFELNHLEATFRDNVPFLYAVVTLDAVRLYHLRSVSLPAFAPDV